MAGVAALQHFSGAAELTNLLGDAHHFAGHQRQRLRGVALQFGQQVESAGEIALADQGTCELNARARRRGCLLDGLLQQLLSMCHILSFGQGGGCLLAKVVRQTMGKVALLHALQLDGHFGRLRPVAGALVQGKQRQPGLLLVAGAVQLAQRFFSAVEQAGFEKVECQSVLRAFTVGDGQVSA